MDLKDIIEMIIHDYLIEGLAFLAGVGLFLYLTFGGGLGDIGRLFAQAFCG